LPGRFSPPQLASLSLMVCAQCCCRQASQHLPAMTAVRCCLSGPSLMLRPRCITLTLAGAGSAPCKEFEMGHCCCCCSCCPLCLPYSLWRVVPGSEPLSCCHSTTSGL
jgi:hypothetical protein